MRPSKLTIANIMTAVLLIAIAIAALRHPTRLWASTLFTLTIALLCWASGAALLTRGGRRGFCVSFAIFGWAHLILTFGSFSGGRLHPPPLLYEMLMDDLRDRSMGPVITGALTGGSFTAFHQVGLTLAILLIALIGGVLGRASCPQPADSSAAK